MSFYKKKVLEVRKKILQLTLEQETQINHIYAKSANRLIDEILELPDISRTRVHDIDIARLLNDYTKDLYKQLYPNIKDNMMESSIIQRQVILDFVDQVAKDRKLSEIVKHNINSYSNTVVKNLIAGEYYKDGKTLSKRLWNLTLDNGNKIDEFIKMNIASGANARKLANDLELLINPNNRIVTNNFKAGFNSYKISYQAQRLARTSITHAATETQIQNAKKNPFSKGLRWNLSASHSARMHGKTDICDDYNGQIFKPEETPLQHPNCLCYFTEEVADIDDAIVRINKWVEGNEDRELESWSTELNKDEENINNKTSDPFKVNGKNGNIDANITKYKNNNENINDTKYNNIIKNDFKPKTSSINHEFKLSNIDWNNKLEINQENSNILNSIHTNLSKFMNDTNTEKLNIISLKNMSIVKELTSGLEESVIPDKEMLNILRKSGENELILTHNHPGETTFSSGDISFILRYKSINALTLECSNGIKYIMQRETLKSSILKEYNFINVYRKIFDNIKKKYTKSVNEDENIWNKFLHEVNIDIAKKYGIKYERIEE
ncbi:hypothetical protein [Clostridium butyricum]|uniref:hypothetical protein n=1 Tax=Clostridium butyricum TaxID=1492 RepID=UPI0020649F0D|nr:MAG TPA: minor capsid protein [Inoviridae sp.]